MDLKNNHLFKALKAALGKPNESKNASEFFVLGLWLLRILTFAFGFYQLFLGERFIGIAIVIAATFLVSPSIFTKNQITDIPLELEFVLFVMVALQYIIGEVHNFYDTVPYYDKFVHFILPFFISFIGFAITYTLYASGKLKVAVGTMIVITILITVGLGALWEIVEYLNDQFLVHLTPGDHKAQGSLTEDPLHDTMNDLIADALGGVVGALIASRYVFHKGAKSKRKNELIAEISKQLSKRR